MNRYYFLIIFMAMFFVAGCGGVEEDSTETASISLSADDAESIPADGISSLTVTAILTDSTNTRVPAGKAAAFTTNLGYFPNGSTSYTVKTDDDTGQIRVSLRSGTQSGIVYVTCESDGVTQSLTLAFSDKDLFSTAAWISLNAFPESIPADGSSTLILTAVLYDPLGNPVPAGTALTFSANMGLFPNGFSQYAMLTTDDTGTASVSLRAGKSEGLATVTCIAGEASQTLAVDFTAKDSGNKTVYILLEADPQHLPADGTASSAISAKLYDSEGQAPAKGTAVTFATTNGEFPNGKQTYTTIVLDNDGNANAVLKAGTNPGNAAIRCAADGAEQTLIVPFTGESGTDTAGITLAASPQEIPADGVSSATITATLTDAAGQPVSKGTGLNFSTTLGAFPNGSSNYATVTPDDSGKVTVSLMAFTEPGTAAVSCTSAGVSQSAAVNFTGESLPAETGWISLNASPDAIPADGESQSLLTAKLYDNTGQPVPRGTAVHFSASAGTFSNGLTGYSAITLDDTGTATAVLRASMTAGISEIRCASGEAVQLTAVRFTGTETDAGTVWITLLAEPESLSADGISSVRITASLHDAEGQPVPIGTYAIFYTNLGQFSNGSESYAVITLDNSGKATASLRSEIAGTARITCASGSASQSLNVIFTEAPPPAKVSWISLEASPDVIPADGLSQTTITATLYDASGNKVPQGTAMTFSTNSGTFSNGFRSYDTITPDNTGKAAAVLRAGTSPGAVQVSCASEDVYQILMVNFTDTSAADQTARITLTAEPDQLPADGESESVIAAMLYDSEGSPVPRNTRAIFSASSGTFPNRASVYENFTPDDSGKLSVSLKAPSIPAQAKIVCTSGDAVQTVFVNFTEGDPLRKTARIVLETDPDVIPADGNSSLSVSATLTDHLGSPVSQGTYLTFFTTAGYFPGGLTRYDTATPDASGRITVSLIAGNVPGTAEITCRSNLVTQQITVEFSSQGETADPAFISLSTESDSLQPGESTMVYARVYDSSGLPIPGVQVLFTLDNPELAYITAQGLTAGNGTASATLTARYLSGEIQITASAGPLTNESPKKVIILDESAPRKIVLTVAPDPVMVKGTATVTATLTDALENPVPNGTAVLFEVENELYGTISPISSTNGGSASVTFKAGENPGQTRITASSGSASASKKITVERSPAAAIEFFPADPAVIAIRGSGGTDTAKIQFAVKDSNGEGLKGVKVALKAEGPNGGEYINPSDPESPDEIEISTDDEGIGTVILHSGYVAGPVTIFARVEVSGTDITARSSVVSIAGGIPSANRLSVAGTLLNLAGLAYNNLNTEITAFLADRFGTYNLLEGTTVSFASEAGLAADMTTAAANKNGVASATIRTQGGDPEDVEPAEWEKELLRYVWKNYADIPGHPRDGLCSVLVYTSGEEYFSDSNANGLYDPGENFADTYEDPFIDVNDDEMYDGSGSADPEELYIDSLGDGNWDGINGEWDSDKYIFQNFPILITGSPLIFASQNTFSVPNGGSQTIKVLVCDRNLNPLPPGSSVDISSDVGKLAGRISYEYANTNVIGPDAAGHLALIEYVFEIYDEDSEDGEPIEQGNITVEVKWKIEEGRDEETKTYKIIGTSSAVSETTTSVPQATTTIPQATTTIPQATTTIPATGECSGCCSGHDGVWKCNEETGRVICADGWPDSICTCSRCGLVPSK